MIEGLLPYPEYRDSELKWMGMFPAHWKISRTKYLLQETNIRSKTGKEQLLKVSQYTGVTQRKSIDGAGVPNTRAKSLVGYKNVTANDLVVNIMLAWNGSLGVSKFDGIVSPAYCVYQFNNGVLPSYFHFLFRIPQYKDRIKIASTGVIESRLRLYSDELGRIEAILPPLKEQAAIVRFLNHANGKIDGFIDAKRKLIDLLNEQKQTIIYRSVTRGLNPSVAFKPSGVDWLGDIPENWNVVRNLALFEHRVEHGVAGLPVLQVSLRSGITQERINQLGRHKRLIADPTKYKLVLKSDMAYNTMRMWQGAVGVSPTDGLVSPAYVVLKARNKTLPEFYDYVFHTEVYKQQVNRQSTGIVSDRNRLYWGSFKQMPNVSLDLEEQDSIVKFIRSEIQGPNEAIASINSEIELIQEYRSSLIADIVTGKLDVREASKRLPGIAIGSEVEINTEEFEIDLLDKREVEKSDE